MRCVPVSWCIPTTVTPVKVWDDTGAGGASGDLTTSTPGLTISNGLKAVNGLTMEVPDESYTIPLPSLPEQRRIVAILDQAFEGISTAKACINMRKRSTNIFLFGFLLACDGIAEDGQRASQHAKRRFAQTDRGTEPKARRAGKAGCRQTRQTDRRLTGSRRLTTGSRNSPK